MYQAAHSRRRTATGDELTPTYSPITNFNLPILNYVPGFLFDISLMSCDFLLIIRTGMDFHVW